MATGIVNFFEKALAPAQTGAVVTPVRNENMGHVSNNPFVTAKGSNPFAHYAQNRPVAGGYFAGYYNNKPNIVGQRLFVEV